MQAIDKTIAIDRLSARLANRHAAVRAMRAAALVPSLLPALSSVLSAREHAARRSTPRYRHPVALRCDICQRPRLDVRSMGRDANGDADAPDMCPVCREESRL